VTGDFRALDRCRAVGGPAATGPPPRRGEPATDSAEVRELKDARCVCVFFLVVDPFVRTV
jgi:hypothetical protein